MNKTPNKPENDPKYSVYKEICQVAYKKITDAGFPGATETGESDFPCSGKAEDSVFELLWDYHYKLYWGSTEGVFREEFDPYFPGAEVEYKYEERIDPQKNPLAAAIRNAVEKVSLTGNIGKRLITLHGTLDTLLPITRNSDKYADLIKQKDKADLHRYYIIEGGTHTDSLYDYPDPRFREKLRPMLPCYRAAFDRLEDWVEKDIEPPENQTVPKPKDGDVVNSCLELEK